MANVNFQNLLDIFTQEGSRSQKLHETLITQKSDLQLKLNASKSEREMLKDLGAMDVEKAQREALKNYAKVRMTSNSANEVLQAYKNLQASEDLTSQHQSRIEALDATISELEEILATFPEDIRSIEIPEQE